jgi:S-DNA-T family DNA segregation ATPase FtsK/SpoIIIE
VASSVPRVGNWGGVGAWMADLLLYIFGLSAWWWCVLLGRSVWTGYRRLSNRFLVAQPVEPEHHQEPLIRAVGFVFCSPAAWASNSPACSALRPAAAFARRRAGGDDRFGMQPTFGFTGHLAAVAAVRAGLLAAVPGPGWRRWSASAA